MGGPRPGPTGPRPKDGTDRALLRIFRWARPTSIYGFSWRPCVRAYVRAYVRVRKLMGAESAMTMKIKVASIYE